MRLTAVLFSPAKCCLAAAPLLLTSCGGSSAPPVSLNMTPSSTYIFQSYDPQSYKYQPFRMTRSDGAPISSLSVTTTGGYCIVGVADLKAGAAEQYVYGRCHPQCPSGETHGIITVTSEAISTSAQITCNINP